MNPNAVFVDTDAWIFLLAQEDRFHSQAVEVLAQLHERDCALITSSAVALEVGGGLATRNLREFSLLFRIMLDAPKVEVVMVDAHWLDAGWRVFDANPGAKWSLTDCLSFAIMREFEMSDAFTYDQHFEQAGFRALLRPSGDLT